MAVTCYKKTALTGGAAGSLDSIDGAGLLDLDMAFVTVGGLLYVYILDDNDGGVESSPDRIAPDANPGSKRWLLQETYESTLVAADLAAHAALTNPHSATDAATASRIVMRDAQGRAKFADPSVAADVATKGYVDGLLPEFRGALVYGFADVTMTSGGSYMLSFTQELYDTSSIHDNSTNPSRLTVPSGVSRVRLSAKVKFTNIAAAGYVCAGVGKNGGAMSADGYGVAIVNTSLGSFPMTLTIVSGIVSVVAGDYFELNAMQVTGSNMTCAKTTSWDTWFAMEIIE